MGNRAFGLRLAMVLALLMSGAIAVYRIDDGGVLAQDPPVLDLDPITSAMTHPHRLADLNWMEIDELVPDVVDRVFLPIGSLEAHGVINNGADTLIPSGLADLVAPRLGALIAPAIPYSVKSSFGLFPGSLQISDEAFSAYVGDVLFALSEEGFENIVILNGHGPNRAILDRLAAKVSADRKVRTIVVDWWTCCEDVTQQVFDTQGGHAGVDETAMVMALKPHLVREDLYHDAMTRSQPKGTSSYPHPSAIMVSDPVQGMPEFDPQKSRAYLHAVVDQMSSVLHSILQSWDDTGL